MWVKQFPKHIPCVVSHISEGWLANGKDHKNKPAGWSPSKDPDRVEVVIVATHAIDQRISHSYREMIRSKKTGRCTSLGTDRGRAYVPGKPTDPRNTFDNAIMLFFAAYFAERGME